MEDFWLYNYNILFKNWNKIFPQKNMSRNEVLNSLTRFSLITMILFFIIKSEFSWYIIPLVIIISSLFLGINNNTNINNDDDDDNKKSNIDHKKNCRLPTNNNPYMNPLSYDNTLNIPACEYNKKDIDSRYKFNLYQNSNDLFDTKNLERQFYTMPVTTVPNDIVTFGKWLYGTNGNCKYDGTRCLQYEDERYH